MGLGMAEIAFAWVVVILWLTRDRWFGGAKQGKTGDSAGGSSDD